MIESTRPSNVRVPLDITLSVWKALFLREALTRLSAGRAAWLWIIVEPAAQVALLMLIFTSIRQRVLPGIDFALFLGIGVIGYYLFKNVASRSANAISANSALFVYRQTRPVDVVFVRVFLEGILQLFVFMTLLAGMLLVGFDIRLHDFMTFIAAWGLLWLFGAGIGLILSVGAELVPEISKIANLLFTPIYFVSGVFFAPFMLPPMYQEWILLNPLVHGMELLRASFFPEYNLAPGISIAYLGAFALFSILLGLAMHLRFATRMAAKQ